MIAVDVGYQTEHSHDIAHYIRSKRMERRVVLNVVMLHIALIAKQNSMHIAVYMRKTSIHYASQPISIEKLISTHMTYISYIHLSMLSPLAKQVIEKRIRNKARTIKPLLIDPTSIQSILADFIPKDITTLIIPYIKCLVCSNIPKNNNMHCPLHNCSHMADNFATYTTEPKQKCNLTNYTMHSICAYHSIELYNKASCCECDLASKYVDYEAKQYTYCNTHKIGRIVIEMIARCRIPQCR
jgi:hypothetical protein